MTLPESLTVGEWNDPLRHERPYDGVERRVLVSDDDVMLVHYTIDADAVFPAHEHDETRQTVYVVDGAIELFGDHERTLETGDSFIVGPGVEHGVRGVAERSELLDSFTPPVAAYRG